MNVPVRQIEGVTILEPKGKITIGVGDVAIKQAVQSALDAGSNNILLNLSGVSTIDSSGIGEVVSAFTTVTHRGGKLKLMNLPKKVHDILQITQLVTVFEIYENEAEALESFVA